MLGQRIGKASKSPGLPTHPLPGHVLEAGLQSGLAGLAGRKLLLQLNQLLSDLLTKVTHTLRPIKLKIKIIKPTKMEYKTIYAPHRAQREYRADTTQRSLAERT